MDSRTSDRPSHGAGERLLVSASSNAVAAVAAAHVSCDGWFRKVEGFNRAHNVCVAVFRLTGGCWGFSTGVLLRKSGTGDLGGDWLPPRGAVIEPASSNRWRVALDHLRWFAPAIPGLPSAPVAGVRVPLAAPFIVDGLAFARVPASLQVDASMWSDAGVIG